MNRIKKGDTVTVITGKDCGKVGKVLATVPSKNKVVVEGVNIATIAKKARKQNEKSEIVKVEKAIDASNVMVNCPTCNRPVRVKFDTVEDKKVRRCVKCDTIIADQNKPEKKTAKKETTKRTRRTKKETETTAEETEVKKTRTRRKAAVKEENKD